MVNLYECEPSGTLDLLLLDMVSPVWGLHK